MLQDPHHCIMRIGDAFQSDFIFAAYSIVKRKVAKQFNSWEKLLGFLTLCHDIIAYQHYSETDCNYPIPDAFHKLHTH